MDFFFFSSLARTSIKKIVASYDIACQWSCNFYNRMATSFPESWVVNRNAVNIRFLVPKFHLPAHIEKCHQDYSFNYAPGVGRTNGEAPECGWSNLNDLAYSTREMGPGSRQDTIEDHIGDRNWTKIVGMGKCLFPYPGRPTSLIAVTYQASISCAKSRSQFHKWPNSIVSGKN